MSSSDILAQLAAEGAIESRGGFSIDKEKAREKMRQFQLADPREYVLMLVQAAVHQGATNIEFQIDADDMQVWFDGEGYSRADLDDLFVSMFGDRGESNLRSRQELAIALNAALALNPRWIRMWSHREGSAVSLELRGGAEALAPAQEAEANDRGGTFIHVKQRFRPGLVLEFVRNLQGTIAEEFILSEQACFAEIPIILDGARISRGVRLGTTVGRVEITAPNAIGACAFEVEHEGVSWLHVLNAGVWVSTHELPAFPAGFVAMVDGRDLRKDVSQTDVVRDEAYTSLIGLLNNGLERSLLKIVRAYHHDPGAWETIPEHLRSRMPMWIAERIEAPWRLEPLGNVLPHYLELPVWRQLDGTWVSTAGLRQRSSVDFLSRPNAPSEEFGDAIQAATEDLRAALRTIFGATVRDRTSAYEAAFAREARRSEVLSRRWHTRLGEGLYLGRALVQGEGIEGEVGIRRGDLEEPVVQLVYEGCLLETIVLERKHIHLPGFVAVVQGQLTPTADWRRARRDEAMARAIHAVIEATVEALVAAGELGQQPPEGLGRNLRELARAVCLPEFDRALYRAVGFSHKRASRWINKFGEVAPEDPFDPPHPLLTMGLFPQLDGPPLSVGELRANHDERNPVRVLDAAGRWKGRYPGYLLTDAQGRAFLKALLGGDGVVDGADDYHAEHGRQAWLSQPEEPFELFGETAHEVAFEAEGMQVEAGLLTAASSGEASGGRSSVRVMKERRTVEFVPLTCPIGGVVMVVDWPRAPMMRDYASLRPNAKPTLQRVADLAPAKLLGSLIEAAEAGEASDADLGWLRSLALVPFSAAWLEPFDRCHDAAGAEPAADRLRKLLQITDKRGGPPSAQTVETLFETGSTGPLEGGPGAAMALAQVVGSNWSRIRGLDLFAALGRRVSIADMLADARRHKGQILVMSATKGTAAFDVDVPRVVLVPKKAELESIERVFGRDHLGDGRKWFEQWRAREAFEQQPEVSLDLDRSAVLVAVPVQAKGTQGEIGIPRELPELPVAQIVACRRRRRIATVEVPEAQAGFVGVLESDSFGKERQFQSLSERDLVRVAAACRKARPMLAEALTEGWSSMRKDDLGLARAWGRVLLELLLGGRGRRGLEEPAPRALAALPLFEHADGSLWTLDAIVRLHDEGEPVYRHDEGRAFEGEWPKLTFCDRPNVVSVLEPFVGELADLVSARRLAVERASNRAASPDMPEPPGDAAEIGHVTGHGAEGMIWIDTRLDSSAVALGDEEKIAGFTDVPRVFVVGGALHGSGVDIEERWAFATLDQQAEKRLRKRARELYEVVFERFVPEAEERELSWDRDREALRGLLARMEREREAGRKLSSGPGRRLHRSLRDLPLFERPDGRLVSLERAERFVVEVAEPAEAGLAETEPAEAEAPEAERDDSPEPKADPKPKDEPKPKPKPKPTPAAMLLDALRTELRIARKGTARAVSNAMLDLVRLGPVANDGALAEWINGVVHIDPDHAVTKWALTSKGEVRARLVSILASSVFTAFNLGLQEVTDQHEVEFHRMHARYLAT